MRTDNQALSPAQLQQLLSEYQLSGKQRPRGWYPPPEEVEPALRTCKLFIVYYKNLNELTSFFM